MRIGAPKEIKNHEYRVGLTPAVLADLNRQLDARELVKVKLLAEREERHRRAGQSRYLVEPNVKDGKGGLRDLHTLFWIAKYVYRVREPNDLLLQGVFSKDEYRIFHFSISAASAGRPSPAAGRRP